MSNQPLSLLPHRGGTELTIRTRTESSASSSLSHARHSAQILDAFLQEGSNPATPGPLSSALTEGRARDLNAALEGLPPDQRNALRTRCGERFLTELTSLSHERDSRVFYAGLLQVGQRLEDNEQLEQAGVVYSALVAEGSHGGLPLPPNVVPPSIRDRAQIRLNAMTGVGSSGERIAFLARRISHEATRPDMLIAMGAAGAAFRLTRLAATARFAGTIESGFGLRAAANATGFLAETMAFTGVGKVAGAAFGQQQDWSPEAVFHEWAGGATMLLGLKLVGAGVGHLSQRWASTESAFGRFTQTVAPQVGMFGGILAGNRLSELAGFHPHREGDTWFVDGLSTLLQFNVAGRLQSAALGEGFRRFERRIDLHTEMLTRSVGAGSARPLSTAVEPGRETRPLQNLLDLMGPEFVTSEGIRIRPSEIEDPTRPLFMVGEGPIPPPPGEGAGSVPPPPGGSEPPPSGSPSERPGSGSSRMKAWANRLNRFVEWRARRDLNRYQDPNAPVSRLRRVPLPAPVESLEQGMLLAIAHGNHGERQVLHTRRVLDMTRDFPLTRQAYLETESPRMDFQREIRKILRPLLPELRMPDYRSLSEKVAVFEHATRDVLGASHAPYEADALLNLYNARRVLDPELRGRLNREDLVRMGLDPNALPWIQYQSDAFLPGAIEAIFRRNPELAAAPGAQEVLEALQNPNPRKAYAATARALTSFAADPNIGPLWLTEVALQASAREMMRRNPEGFLLEVLARGKPASMELEAIPEFAARMTRFRAAHDQLQFEQGRPRPRRFLIGRPDFGSLHRAMGEYFISLTELLLHHENHLIPQAVEALDTRLSRLSPDDIAALQGARAETSVEFDRIGTEQRAQFERLEAPIRNVFEVYDTRLEGLRPRGSRVGFLHVTELMGEIRERIGAQRYDREVAPRFRELQGQYEAALAEYRAHAPEAREGKLNPRDFNRKIEKQVEPIYKDAYRLVIATGTRFGMDMSEVRRILPFYETFVHKADLPREMTRAEHIGRIARFALPALSQVTRFKSGLNHGYSFDAMSRVFQDFGSKISESANPQTFYYDPALENVLDYFHYANSGDHNTHLDFIGHAGNLVQALLGSRARAHHIPDILAKIDLSIPLIEQVFPYFTNMIPNDFPGVRRSEVRAAHMEAFGSLPHGRVRPTMPLGYDNITMDVTNGEGPYTRDPHAPTSGSLPVMGRPFGIAEAATVITGRPQGINFVQDPGAIRNYPSQRGSPALLNNPSSMVSQFFPLSAMPEPTPRTEKVTLRNNVERLMWYLQGFHPVTDPAAPHTDAIYDGYRRPLDPETERVVATLFDGAWELYPTAEGISRLETQSREARSRMETAQREKRSEDVSRALRDYELVQNVLDVQTRQLLRTELTVFDQRVATELAERPGTREAKGLRRMQRILRSRLKLMEQVERKVARREALSLTERRFVEKAGAAIAGRDNVSGTDRILEQLNYYFATRDIGVSLQSRLLQSQQRYYEFVRQWTEARRDPTRPEHSQLHVSEAEGYQDIWKDYRLAIETLFNLHGITPSGWSGSRFEPVVAPIYRLLGLNPNGWDGEIFPDINFRREGGVTIVEPRGWEPSSEFRKSALGRFFWNDTLGIVPLAKAAKNYDPTPNLYLAMHRAWGHRALVTTQTRIRLENTENLIDLASRPRIIAPTHDSVAEFPLLPSILHDYGLRAFFVAKSEFFEPFHFEWRPVKIFGRKIQMYLPALPFGLIRGLLGPMEQYGHFSLNRGGSREEAIRTMEYTGRFINEDGRSVIIFPTMSRSRIKFDENGQRYEGPIYAVKGGIGATMEASRAPIQPIGLVNGGIISPPQFGQAFISPGTAIGRDYIWRFGEPIYYETVVPGNPEPKGIGLRKPVQSTLNDRFHQLTGRPIGPEYQSRKK